MVSVPLPTIHGLLTGAAIHGLLHVALPDLGVSLLGLLRTVSTSGSRWQLPRLLLRPLVEEVHVALRRVALHPLGGHLRLLLLLLLVHLLLVHLLLLLLHRLLVHLLLLLLLCGLVPWGLLLHHQLLLHSVLLCGRLLHGVVLHGLRLDVRHGHLLLVPLLLRQLPGRPFLGFAPLSLRNSLRRQPHGLVVQLLLPLLLLLGRLPALVEVQ
mmetsp:Transcript_30684/g.85590  ORF Transcript_30684/g.85590 Transcript_30684/m.85590 type:complete len:211 (-) Transcript_30684:268-900(-)